MQIFLNYAKRIRFYFVTLQSLSSNFIFKSGFYTGMRLFVNITPSSFVQSNRRFERNSYVHTFSTYSNTNGIGFPYLRHSYFYKAS